MAAVAQAGHMTNEYSKYKVIHVLYMHPGENNLRVLRALAVCFCSCSREIRTLSIAVQLS